MVKAGDEDDHDKQRYACSVQCQHCLHTSWQCYHNQHAGNMREASGFQPSVWY